MDERMTLDVPTDKRIDPQKMIELAYEGWAIADAKRVEQSHMGREIDYYYRIEFVRVDKPKPLGDLSDLVDTLLGKKKPK